MFMFLIILYYSALTSYYFQIVIGYIQTVIDYINPIIAKTINKFILQRNKDKWVKNVVKALSHSRKTHEDIKTSFKKPFHLYNPESIDLIR